MLPTGPEHVRAVTNLMVDAAGIDDAISIISGRLANVR